jgi:hypothetical protein
MSIDSIAITVGDFPAIAARSGSTLAAYSRRAEGLKRRNGASAAHAAAAVRTWQTMQPCARRD